MENIKHGIFLSLLAAFLCIASTHASEMNDIARIKTRYVVRESWVRNHREVVTEKAFDNFNDLLKKIRTAVASEEGKKPNNAQYLNLRMQIMKAIALQIEKCFIAKINSESNKLEEADIEPDYIRNLYAEIQDQISNEVISFIAAFVPCALLTDSKYWDILQRKGNVFSRYSYYVKEDDSLAELNHFLSWVEELARITLSDLGNAEKAENIDKMLIIFKTLNIKTASVKEIIEKSIKTFTTNTFKPLIIASLTGFHEQSNKLKADAAGKQAYLDLLHKVITFSNARLNQNINKQLVEDKALGDDFNSLKNILHQALKSLGLSDEDIANFENKALVTFSKQFADFEKNYNKLKESNDLANAPIEKLVIAIQEYIAIYKPLGANKEKITKLLALVEALKSKALTPDKARVLLYSLELAFNTLHSLSK